MTEEQKRLEKALLKFIEKEITNAVPRAGAIPETANALIDLWRLTDCNTTYPIQNVTTHYGEYA